MPSSPGAGDADERRHDVGEDGVALLRRQRGQLADGAGLLVGDPHDDHLVELLVRGVPERQHRARRHLGRQVLEPVVDAVDGDGLVLGVRRGRRRLPPATRSRPVRRRRVAGVVVIVAARGEGQRQRAGERERGEAREARREMHGKQFLQCFGSDRPMAGLRGDAAGPRMKPTCEPLRPHRGPSHAVIPLGCAGALDASPGRAEASASGQIAGDGRGASARAAGRAGARR